MNIKRTQRLFLLILAALSFSCSLKRVNRQELIAYPDFDMQAHRGGRGVMPENTVSSMLYALDLGVNTLEMDALVSADGKVILSHDNHINPLITLTPEGKEISESEREKYAFMQMKYADIKKFDVGTKFFSLYPQQRKIKEYIPLLSEVIDQVQKRIKQSGKPQVFYNIEIKSAEAGDNTLNPIPEVFVEKVMAVVNRKKVAPYTIIQSSDVRVLRILHKKYPEIKTSYLVGYKKKGVPFEELMRKLGYTPFIFSPNYKIVTPLMVKLCHELGMKMVVWTPNTKEEIDRLKSLGVDGVITDYPELFFNTTGHSKNSLKNKTSKVGFSIKPYTNSASVVFDNVRGASVYELRYASASALRSKTVASSYTNFEIFDLKASESYNFEGRVLYQSKWSDWSAVQTHSTASFETTVGTYNILSAVHDDVFPEHTWSTRKKALIRIIKELDNRPDILGIQEAMDSAQLQYLTTHLKGIYNFHISKRNISPRAIFWSKNKFDLVSFDDEVEILDSTKSGRLESRLAHVRLKEKCTGKDILVFNVHLPSSYHSDKEEQRNLLARALSKKAIEMSAASGNLPVIVVGDFNSLPIAEENRTTAAIIMRNAGFSDSFYDASESKNAFYATHDRITTGISSSLGVQGGSSKRIDYIFTYPKPRVHTSDYRVVLDFEENSGTKLRRPIPSDHRPVRTTLHLFY